VLTKINDLLRHHSFSLSHLLIMHESFILVFFISTYSFKFYFDLGNPLSLRILPKFWQSLPYILDIPNIPRHLQNSQKSPSIVQYTTVSTLFNFSHIFSLNQYFLKLNTILIKISLNIFPKSFL